MEEVGYPSPGRKEDDKTAPRGDIPGAIQGYRRERPSVARPRMCGAGLRKKVWRHRHRRKPPEWGAGNLVRRKEGRYRAK